VTPGSEPRHAAPPSEVPDDIEQEFAGSLDRVAEIVAQETVQEAGLHAAPEEGLDEDEPLPSISEQMAEQLGGVRGLIESSIPVLVFVLLNVVLTSSLADLEKRPALYWAIAGSVLSAIGIGVYRLARKEPVRHAINGLFGIAIGAWLAWKTGEAKNFYLPGILLTLGQVAILIVSVAVRKPLIGYAWGVLANKGKHDWLQHQKLFRAFQWLTLVWAGSLFVRAAVQGYFYLSDQANAIGIARILISWPIYAATFAYTVWAVRRVTHEHPAN
jgi:hypothetical protein